MEKIKHDLLIVGGGATGLRAAIAAAENNPKLSIALISKVYPVRSHTVSAEGGIGGVLRDYDTFDSHAFDTIKGSDYLADQDAVEFFVNEAPKEIIQLEHWGCPWSRDSDGQISVRAFGGMSVKRTVYAADKTGFYMLNNLFERSLKYENIVRYDEWFVTHLFTDEKGITGLFALDLRNGKFITFESSTIIIATGGAGKIYEFTTNGNICTGDGMALALQAGASLKDMEFVQFHPTGLPRTGILITEGARGEGGYLLNKNGERFLKNYLPEKMEIGPRDLISQAMTKEIQEGRGFEGPYGPYLHLDLRHLGEKLINERLPLIRELSIEFAGIDPVHEPIPVRPVVHYFMGGAHTNKETKTDIPGLFAAGEAACVSINGANRLGSNSLSECLVFGRVAGEKAAAFATETGQKKISEKAISDQEDRLKSLLQNSGKEKVPDIRHAMQKTMEGHAGIMREKKSLEQGIEKILVLRKRFSHISLTDRSLIFNTEFTSLLELDFMLDVSLSVLTAAFHREESRGAHYRTDFLKRDDQKFLKHFIIRKEGTRMKVEEIPVTITKWQPAERKY